MPAKKHDMRVISVGDVVTVQRQGDCVCGSRGESYEVKLVAGTTNLNAEPKELGPTAPLHRALIGRKVGAVVTVKNELKVLDLKRDSERGH